MNRMTVISLALALCCIVGVSRSQDLEITSFDRNGNLTWTNSVSNASYRIEWSPSLKDGWNRASPFEPIAGTGLVMSAKVPMFYRVIMIDPNHSISGTVFYSTNPLPDQVINLYTLDWTVINSATSDLNGHYILTGVTNGEYQLGCKTDGTYMGGWRSLNIDGQDLVNNIYRKKPIVLLSPPNGSAVSTNQPTFQWNTLPEADHFTFQMNVTTNWQLVDWQHDLPSNTYQTGVVLSNGVQYTWQVDVQDADGHDIGYSPQAFTFIVDME